MGAAGDESDPPAAGDDAPGGTSIRSAAGTDFADASWPRRLALVGVLAWVVYEWGPGNETLTPWLLARVIYTAESAWSIPLAALVGFSFTLAQQLASGFTALAGFSVFDRTARAAWNRLRGESHTAPGEWSRLGWPGRAAIVFPLGTTSVALIQIMTTGEVGVRRHRRVIVASAVLCATLVAAIAAVAAVVALVGRNVEGLEGTTNWLLRILGNPLFWLALIVLTVGGRKVLTLGDHSAASDERSAA